MMMAEDELLILEEIKMKSLQYATERLRIEADSLKAEALDIAQKRQTVEWNLQRSEFAKLYEGREFEKRKGTLNKLRGMVESSEQADSALTHRLHSLREGKEELMARTTQSKDSIDCLLKAKSNAEDTIAQLQRDNAILKKRNAAIWLKLNKQKQEFDDQIDKYSTRLMAPALKRKQ